MKKIKSIYILFILAALSAYGLWGCNNNGSETTSDNETVEKTALDSLPVVADMDSDFYIKVNVEGKEHTFNFLSLDRTEGNNILTPNLFRMKRCEDVNCINSFYLQAHNFDFDQTPPFTLKENNENGKKKKIILSFITMNKNAQQFRRIKPEDVSNTQLTINKIEGDIYEGSFDATVFTNSNQDSLSNQSSLNGSFRMKMIVDKPAVN